MKFEAAPVAALNLSSSWINVSAIRLWPPVSGFPAATGVEVLGTNALQICPLVYSTDQRVKEDLS
ncbi:hypothetical protein C8Q78DRAFT_1074848 [Trametes maxima]|nr:hypothetical protein C8Q78DRAFT_1074848 [Trametes maxima]